MTRNRARSSYHLGGRGSGRGPACAGLSLPTAAAVGALATGTFPFGQANPKPMRWVRSSVLRLEAQGSARWHVGDVQPVVWTYVKLRCDSLVRLSPCGGSLGGDPTRKEENQGRRAPRPCGVAGLLGPMGALMRADRE